MTSLLKLPVRAAWLATAPTRFAVRTVLRFVRDDAESPQPEAPRPAPEPARKPRRAARRPRPAPIRTEPTRAEAAAVRQAEHPTGPEIEVAEPWEGYDAMTEEQVLDRLTGADPTLRAAVRLYESLHGGRRQILISTEEPVPQP